MATRYQPFRSGFGIDKKVHVSTQQQQQQYDSHQARGLSAKGAEKLCDAEQ